MRISLIVPVGGAAPAWPRCARSLGRLEPPPAELLVVLDGVVRDAVMPDGAIPDATVLPLDQCGGPARARNAGAQVATGDVLLFVDSDIEVPTDLIIQVAAQFEAQPEISAVIGSYDDAPGDPGFLSQYRNLLHHHVHQTGRPDASTFWAGCGAIHRAAFLAVGGFDERYAEPSIEDIELGGRLHQAGHAIHLAKALQVKHLKEWRLAGMVRTDLWCRAVPWTELLIRQGGLINDLNVKTRDRWSVMFAFLAPMALAGAVWWPLLLVVVGAAGLGILLLNASFFAFLRDRLGFTFVFRALPAYWLYLTICGLGFVLGWLRHICGGSQRASIRPGSPIRRR